GLPHLRHAHHRRALSRPAILDVVHHRLQPPEHVRHPAPRAGLLLELPEVHLEALPRALAAERVLQPPPRRPRADRPRRRPWRGGSADARAESEANPARPGRYGLTYTNLPPLPPRTPPLSPRTHTTSPPRSANKVSSPHRAPRTGAAPATYSKRHASRRPTSN